MDKRFLHVLLNAVWLTLVGCLASTDSFPAATIVPQTTAVSSPTPFSHSGQLLFSSRRLDTNGDGFVQVPDAIHIYSMGMETGRLTQLSRGDAYYTAPVWSPDGTQIAFVSTQTGGVDLFVMGADGSNPRQLTSGYERVAAPDWSPDGTQIVFSGGRATAPQLHILTVESLEVRQVSEGETAVHNPHWSKDGRFIIYHNIDEEGDFRPQLLEIERLAHYPLTLANGDLLSVANLSWHPNEDFLSGIEGQGNERILRIFELVWREERPFLRVTPFEIENVLEYDWIEGRRLIIVSPQADSSAILVYTVEAVSNSAYDIELESSFYVGDDFFESNPDWNP